MIASHSSKFIFLHTRKAAGSAIRASLARYLRDNDVMAGGIYDCYLLGALPATREVKQHLTYATPTDSCVDKEHVLRAHFSIKEAWECRLGDDPAHPNAEALAKYFIEYWPDYTKFCVVRDPWSKTISDYYWRLAVMRPAKTPSFTEYVDAIWREGAGGLNGLIPLAHDNWPLYTISDSNIADHVVRYSRLSRDLNEVLSGTIGLDWDGWLPKIKQSRRATDEAEQHKRHYDGRTEDLVGQLYHKEISAMDFTPPRK